MGLEFYYHIISTLSQPIQLMTQSTQLTERNKYDEE